MARNLKVKLRFPETSLTCPETGWYIQGEKSKRTPKTYSKRVNEWVKNGALVALENIGESGGAVQDLLDTKHKGLSKPQLIDFAKHINAAEGKDVIEVKEVNKPDLVDAIQAWKDKTEKVETDGKS